MTNAPSARRPARDPGGLGALAASLLLLLSACATTPPPPLSDIGFGLPSPRRGPGRPPLEKAQQRDLEEAWSLLVEGQTAAARDAISRVDDLPAAGRLLLLQADLVEGQPVELAALETLASEHPEYAAIWITLSLAAERAGDEAMALEAGRRGGAQWDVAPWDRRPSQLYEGWVVARVAEAARLLEAGQPESALDLVDRALALDPPFRDGIVVRARALLALGRTAEAEVLLASLPGDAEAIVLAGGIAEQRQDWQTAMELYDSLPDSHPDKAAAVGRTRLRWRLTNLPPYVHKALASSELSREQLAVLLVALAPQTEAIEGGTVPVLSDIVDLPSQREVLTAVRLDLIEVDRIEHEFMPRRRARREEVRGAIDGLCHLLGLDAPVWCDADAVVPSSCQALPEPITGQAVAELLVALVEGEAR